VPDRKANKKERFLARELESDRKMIYLSFWTRFLSLLIAIIVAFALKFLMGVGIPDRAFYVLYLWAAIVLGYTFIFRFLKSPLRKNTLENIHLSYFVFGAALTTALIHYVGGVGWIGVIFYSFDVVYSNVLMKRSRGMIVTLIVLINYLLLVALEYNGILPRYNVIMFGRDIYGDLTGYIYPTLLVAGGYLVLLSSATGLFSRLKQERESRLIRSRNRYRAKSDQLEKMAKRLRKQVAENTYIKRATMGYIEKKEFELEQTRKDLEQQIEKLRKTQKAMVFMIEDLNEMSGQLKDTRDNLETKVRERTDELLSISRKLHRSERLAFLGKLAGSVTHELRNPLAVLKNAAYYLDRKKGGITGEKADKYIAIIKKEINTIDSIIDDIMGFAKTKGPELEKADINDIVDNAVSTINVPEMITVHKDFSDLPEVEIDSNQVLHAVMNISNNAIMAMKGNGELTFRTWISGPNVCLSIKDNGPGIPPDQRDLIFEPLYSSKPKGTGLGLPIARMMIENQEGKIDFTSELGQGTEFVLCIPVKRVMRGR
jgi:signal transduction histidine kinase